MPVLLQRGILRAGAGPELAVSGTGDAVDQAAAVVDLHAAFGHQFERQRIDLVLDLEHACGKRLLRCRRVAR